MKLYFIICVIKICDNLVIMIILEFNNKITNDMQVLITYSDIDNKNVDHMYIHFDILCILLKNFVTKINNNNQSVIKNMQYIDHIQFNYCGTSIYVPLKN